MTPLVTVGVPFHNEAPYLREAVESILRQSFGDFEVLLIDDASTDGSLAIARELTREDHRVHLLVDGTRRRLPARLNQIVCKARGTFIARMDADDINHPERFARELQLLEEDSTVDAVGTWIALIGEDRSPFAVAESSTDQPSLRVALQHDILIHPTVIGRTAWFRRFPYDESLYRAEDRDLWCRTVSSSRFAVVREPLYLVRVLPKATGFAEDYRLSQRHNRVLFARHGPRALGLVGAARAYLGTFGRSLVMTAAARSGLAERLVRRRGRLPTAKEASLIDEALRFYDNVKLGDAR